MQPTKYTQSLFLRHIIFKSILIYVCLFFYYFYYE